MAEKTNEGKRGSIRDSASSQWIKCRPFYMTGKKGIIAAVDLVSLRLRYHISDFFELSAPSERETLRSHRKGYVCLNKWMFKEGVRIPLEFGISKLLNVFGAAPIQISPNS
ncbi:hypothetical protein ACLOJK_006969 [Asimina triloba]